MILTINHLMLQVLVEKGANPLLPTRDEDTAWAVAGEWAHLDDEGTGEFRAVFFAMEPRVVRMCVCVCCGGCGWREGEGTIRSGLTDWMQLAERSI